MATKSFRIFQPTTIASIVVKNLLTAKWVQGILASDARISLENAAACSGGSAVDDSATATSSTDGNGFCFVYQNDALVAGGTGTDTA